MSLSKETTVAIVAGSAVALVGAAALCAYRHRSDGPPKKWRKVGELSSLRCYPIKSCGVVELEEAECAILGLKSGNLRDRVLMVTGLDYSFKTSRTHPKMILVQPRIEGDVVHLTAPEMPEIEFSLNTLSKEVSGEVWSQNIKVLDCGDEVAAWLSKYILGSETGCRLVYYSKAAPAKKVKPKNRIFPIQNKDTGGLSDATSYMIINEASVVDLNTRLPEGSKQCSSLQFRPNFTVKGHNLKPYEEDDWEWVKIGDTVFRVVLPCTRCISTTVDPFTGVRDRKMEPLKTLKSYRIITDPKLRPATGDSPFMGQHLAVHKEGHVRLGDAVYVGA